jgi:serine/threonine-protein kinase HipA
MAMMLISKSPKPLYVYLQRPDTGEWVTVGRYLLDEANKIGKFLYAPSYEQAGLSWSIDPVNLPFIPDTDYIAPRYNGLHDILRDACPDAWGKMLIQRDAWCLTGL